MKDPMFSVIMPTYNRPAETLRAVRSVIGQSFGDWELIIVDDCSEDTDHFRDTFLLDKRVRIYSTEEQSGSPVVPRNLGVEKATGNWLAFLDSDDEWRPNKLFYIRKGIDKTSFMLLLFYHDMLVAGKKGFPLWSSLSHCYSGSVFPKLLVKNFIPTSSVVMPKALWEPMNPTLRISHDWDLWLKVARKTNVYFLSEVLGTLSLHEGSVITQTRRRRAESREVVRRHAPFCKSRWVRWKAWWRYRLIEIWDFIGNAK